jgi:hypothetical protein
MTSNLKSKIENLKSEVDSAERAGEGGQGDQMKAGKAQWAEGIGQKNTGKDA